MGWLSDKNRIYRYTLARTLIRPRYQASLFIYRNIHYIHSASSPRTVIVEPAGAMEVRTAIYDKSYEKPRQDARRRR